MTEIPKHRPPKLQDPNEAAEDWERQRELYRRGGNHRNIRKQRQAKAAEAPAPFVPAKPLTVKTELAKMLAIMEGEDDA